MGDRTWNFTLLAVEDLGDHRNPFENSMHP